ncbi:MAG: peptidylprolyl isomerase [Planctomycetota bacterium]
MKRIYQLIFLILVSVAVRPAADAAQNPHIMLETNFGNITIELYPEDAPVTVDNFLSYVNDGFYDGLVFHRVIKDFMIQAGAHYTVGYTIYSKPPTYGPIINEGDNGWNNVRGTISTALSNSADSATSQFFINHVDNPHLDHDYPDGNGYGHCVFGTVIEGMDVVDSIATSDVAYVDASLTHFPYNPPVFIHATYELPCELSYCSDLAAAGRISFPDFAMFASYWLDDCNSANGFCDGADLDYSGGIDIADLDLFWNHWTRTAGYESRFSDLAPDDTINLADVIALVSRWLDADCHQDNNYCDRADINRDGTVDLVDYFLLSSNWLSY